MDEMSEGESGVGRGLKVLAAHAGKSPERGFLSTFGRLAAFDQFGVHTLVEDPADADLILFLDVNEHCWDLNLAAVRDHPLVARYAEKSLVYDEQDQPWCAMPGLYVSMPRRGFDRRRQRACGYITQTLNPLIAAQPAGPPAATEAGAALFSFVGRNCHAVRERLLRVRHPRGLIEDSSAFPTFEASQVDREERHRRYVQALLKAKFALCPRGAGTTSYRLFEAMWAGRAPVVISDDWVPPAGPAWDRFALFISEAKAAEVGSILETHETRAAEMGREARRQWEQWYAPEVLFHRMVEQCASILRSRRLPESIARRLPNARRLRLIARRWKAGILNRGRQ